MISTARDNESTHSPSQKDYYYSPTRNGQRDVLFAIKTPEDEKDENVKRALSFD